MEKDLSLFEARDFGTRFSAALRFLRAHFRPLLGIFFKRVLPFAALGIGLSAVLISRLAPAFVQSLQSHYYDWLERWPFFLLLVGELIFILSYWLLYVLVVHYMRAHQQVSGETPAAAPAMGSLRVLGRLLLLMFCFFLIFMAGCGLAVLIIRAFSLLISFLLLLALLVLFFYLAVRFSLAPVLLVFEDLSVLRSIARSLLLTRAYFWDTLGYGFAIYLTQGLINYVFLVPLYALKLIGYLGLYPLDAASFSSVLITVLVDVLSFGGMLFASVISTSGMVFQYGYLLQQHQSAASGPEQPD